MNTIHTRLASSTFAPLRRATAVIPVLALLFALGFASTARANTYQIDDGTAESNAGNGLGGDFIALNEFTVTGGNNLITDIAIAWARTGDTSYNGLSYTAILWEDNSGIGNPAGASLLATIPGQIISGSGTNTFDISTFTVPQLVTTQDFFVGLLITTTPSQSPIASDISMLLTGRSFYALNSPGAGDISNLSNNPSGILTFGPTFMIRADAVPEPSTYALLGLAVPLCLLRFLGRPQFRNG